MDLVFISLDNMGLNGYFTMKISPTLLHVVRGEGQQLKTLNSGC